MTLDKAYVRKYVRELLDVDSGDISDLLIDRWCSEAQTRIARTISHWPFYELEATVGVTAGVTDYPDALTQFREIASIDGAGLTGPLVQIDEAQAKAAFWTSGVSVPRYPRYWSVWGSTLRLWPEPIADVELTITGYRPPVALADAAGATFDLPADFHEAALEWVLHKAYLHQQDLELGQIHLATFQSLLETLTADEVNHGASDPIVFGGGIVSHRIPRGSGWNGPTLNDPGWGEFS